MRQSNRRVHTLRNLMIIPLHEHMIKFLAVFLGHFGLDAPVRAFFLLNFPQLQPNPRLKLAIISPNIAINLEFLRLIQVPKFLHSIGRVAPVLGAVFEVFVVVALVAVEAVGELCVAVLGD